MTQREEFIAAVDSPLFSHVSVRQWCGPQAFVYHCEPSSPTGVTCAAGLPEEEAAPILAARNVTAFAGPQRGDMAATS